MTTKTRPLLRAPILTALVIASLAVMTTFVGSASASAASTGTISGTVLGQGTGGNPDVPLADVSVSLTLPGGNYVRNAGTGDDGTFTFTNLPPADYIIEFVNAFPPSYLDEYLGNTPNAASATVIHLADGESTTADITLPAIVPGTISGTVTNSAGNPVSGANVVLNDGTGYGGNDRTTSTDDSGNYALTDVVQGTYTVDISPPDNANLVATSYASSLVVAPGQDVTHIDVTMPIGATISGTVTEADHPGIPLGGGWVQLVDPNGYDQAGTQVNDDGTFTMVGVRTGSFTIQVQAFESGYASQYWQGEPTFAAADFFSVTMGDTLRGFDVALQPGASISGTISAVGLTPKLLSESFVQVISTSDPLDGSGANVAADGTYTVSGLTPGSYRVDFKPPSRARHIAEQWWNNSVTAGGSTPITLAQGQAVTGINASLVTGATISGTISGLARNGSLFVAQNAQVLVDLPDGTVYSDAVYADLSGKYTIPNLPAGTYKLHFNPQPDTTDFVPEWYNNQATEQTATTVTVTSGQSKVINATLASATLKAVTPKITGAARVGSTLSAHPGAWHPGAVSFAFQWLRDGAPISGATASTYVPAAADVGLPLEVAVIGSEPGFTTESLSSSPTKPVTNGRLSTSVPTISGTLTKGSTLTANAGSWGPGPVTLSYKWFRGTARIVGATAASYTLINADVGKAITVKVIGSEFGYNTATVASAPTPVIG